MSSDRIILEPHFDWTSSDEEEINPGAINVERLVNVIDPSNVNTNRAGMLEQGITRVIAQSVELPRSSIVEPSTSGRSLGILSDSSTSVLANVDLAIIRAIYRIPNSVKLRIPKMNERADWDIPGWMCFYEYIFRLGFRFPILSLARHMLVYYDIAPSQLMPNSLRILLSLTILRERHGIKFGLGCLLYNYYLKEHISDKEITSKENKFPCANAPERTMNVLDIPIEVRSWRVLLIEVLSMASAKINVPGAVDTLRQYRDHICKKRVEEANKAKGKSTEVLPELNDISKAQNDKLDKLVKELIEKNLALEDGVNGLKAEISRQCVDMTKSKEIMANHEGVIVYLEKQVLSIAIEVKPGRSFSSNTYLVNTPSGIPRKCMQKSIIMRRWSA
ncbi:hypothetical protein Ddye_006148 [Dipteronia dyeriana]|uniref:Uncharacterized protein n=1 Tax=Dipteronia dyeriana TaxID=168575 RepID=A0AAD9XHU4_9ROSI|nr:hypothetical protein Ddye_006148 [Dipteronia dyeriana]